MFLISLSPDQIFIIIVLLGIEISVLALARWPKTKKLFDVLPAVFWIYFIPMIFSTAGLIDSQNIILKNIPAFFLPVSLFLILIAVDVRAIVRLGPLALTMFFLGSAGMMVGAVISFLLFKETVGHEFALGFGALCASWTGGSANMIAVKEALAIPENIFTPMVVVDTIVPYVWMAVLVALVRVQTNVDRANRARRDVLDDLAGRISGISSSQKINWHGAWVVGIVALGLLASFAVSSVAQQLPEIKGIVSTYAWTIILVTFLGIALSLTPFRTLESRGSTQIGYCVLYFVLTAIGAKASLANIPSGVVLIAAGFVMVVVHAIFMMAGMRILKVPMFLTVTASQANIGGVASAPVVAEIYQPGFSSVGLLLAILGNIVGTYLGIMTAYLCQWVGRL